MVCLLFLAYSGLLVSTVAVDISEVVRNIGMHRALSPSPWPSTTINTTPIHSYDVVAVPWQMSRQFAVRDVA